MNLVDSSGWLEVLLGGPNKEYFNPVLMDRGALLVPALVAFEVTKIARVLRGKTFGEAIWNFVRSGIFIEVSASITATAIEVSITHKLATADSLIYATALEYDATLWTQDKHFKGLPHVKYFEKSA